MISHAFPIGGVAYLLGERFPNRPPGYSMFFFSFFLFSYAILTRNNAPDEVLPVHISGGT